MARPRRRPPRRHPRGYHHHHHHHFRHRADTHWRPAMTVLDPALHTALRALKLTGMLETLDTRLAQARAGDLGHLDFLQVLCEDESARRESAAFARRLRRAHFEEQVSFETFDFTANPKLPAAADHVVPQRLGDEGLAHPDGPEQDHRLAVG